MAGKLTDQNPQWTVFTNGSFGPAAGGTIEFFENGGTSTQKPTYFQEPFTVPNQNANPLSLGSNGRPVQEVFLDGEYTYQVKAANGDVIDTVDNVIPVGGSAAEGSVDFVVVENVADLATVDTTAIQAAYVLGTAASTDGGNGWFYYAPASSESDNGVNVIEPDVGGGRWSMQNNTFDTLTIENGAGTTDAITITPTPAVASLNNQKMYLVRSLGANTLTNPTFKVGSSSALTGFRSDGIALAVGDCGPIGYIQQWQLKSDDSAYILLNPYKVAQAQYVADSINQAAMGLLSVGTPELINDSVNLTKLLNMSSATFLGQTLGGSGDPIALSASQAKTALAIASGDVSGLGALAVLDYVTASTIASGAVDEDELAANAVRTAKINNLAVTTGKIANSAVGQTQLASNSVSNVKIINGSVNQSKLDTPAAATVSVTSTAVPSGFEVDIAVIGGGSHGFYPQSALSAFTDNGGYGCAIINGVQVGDSTNAKATYVGTMLGSPTASLTSITVDFTQEYIASSPPFNIGDGDIANFTYVLMTEDHGVKGVYSAGVPPWAYNGPTSLKPTRTEEVDGVIKKYTKIPKSTPTPPWEGGDPELYRLGPSYEEIEIDHSVKNKDMPLLPHPFVPKNGDYVIMLEPCCSFMDSFADIHERRENVSDIIRAGYIDFSEEVTGCCKPSDGVIIRRPKWKLSK